MLWVTPILPLLKSNDTPLTTGPLSSEEVSWVVAFGSVGSMFAALPIRGITNRVGCKRLMTSYLAILSIVSNVQCARANAFQENIFHIFSLQICWLLLAFGRTKYEILIARLLCGCIGAGSESAVLLFVSEISDDR